jgi:hypothetical protein
MTEPQCECYKNFKSWKYVGPVPSPRGPEHEKHLWECVICGHEHMTMDKVKPKQTGRLR